MGFWPHPIFLYSSSIFYFLFISPVPFWYFWCPWLPYRCGTRKSDSNPRMRICMSGLFRILYYFLRGLTSPIFPRSYGATPSVVLRSPLISNFILLSKILYVFSHFVLCLFFTKSGIVLFKTSYVLFAKSYVLKSFLLSNFYVVIKIRCVYGYLAKMAYYQS